MPSSRGRRAALGRFVEELRTSDPAETIRTGLRDPRHVIFEFDAAAFLVPTPAPPQIFAIGLNCRRLGDRQGY
ncbi:hypothetical protein ACFY1U_36620 [Streptomyces sp. NPDC001351]|uniref:hypothetical protein n=1 Tax=Streptomyces sp. NPDC001351 TaxID=3364564 RepID=UPI0036BD0B51